MNLCPRCGYDYCICEIGEDGMISEKLAELEAKINELKVQLMESDTLASDYHGWFRDAEDKASQRLELLRRWNKKRVENGDPCPFCEKCTQMEYEEGSHEKLIMIDVHTADCDLAKELRDSRLARELGAQPDSEDTDNHGEGVK